MSPRIVFLIVGAFAVGTNAMIVTGILPLIAEELDTTVGIAGLSVTAFAISYAISAPILPVLMARLHRRTIMAISLGAFVLANLGSVLADDIVTFLVTRGLVGVAAACFTPQASAVAVSMVEPARRGRAITLVLLGISAAAAVGVPMGTLVGDAFGYRAAFVLVAALGTVALIGMIWVPRTSLPTVVGIREQLLPLGRPSVLALAFTTMLIATGFSAVSSYFAPLFDVTADVSTSELALVLSIFGATGIVTLLAGGRLLDRFGGFRVNAVSLSAMVVATVLLPFATELAVVIALIIPWSAFGNVTIPGQQLELGNLYPENPAPMFALNSSSIFLGSALGGVLGSIAVEAGAVRELPFLAAIPLALALVMTLLRLAKGRRDTVLT